LLVIHTIYQIQYQKFDQKTRKKSSEDRESSVK